MISPDGRYNDNYISNYAIRNIKDQLSRIEGVGRGIGMGPRWLRDANLA